MGMPRVPEYRMACALFDFDQVSSKAALASANSDKSSFSRTPETLPSEQTPTESMIAASVLTLVSSS
jgi:hypothetical protein